MLSGRVFYIKYNWPRKEVMQNLITSYRGHAYYVRGTSTPWNIDATSLVCKNPVDFSFNDCLFGFTSNSGTLSFDYLLSTEQDYDYFVVWLSDALGTRIVLVDSGEKSDTFSCGVTAGEVYVRFDYILDGGTTGVANKVEVTNLVLPQGAVPIAGKWLPPSYMEFNDTNFDAYINGVKANSIAECYKVLAANTTIQLKHKLVQPLRFALLSGVLVELETTTGNPYAYVQVGSSVQNGGYYHFHQLNSSAISAFMNLATAELKYYNEQFVISINIQDACTLTDIRVKYGTYEELNP